MACFAGINVSQGSVATYARCGGIFNTSLSPNLPRNLSVKKFNRLRFDTIMVMSLWPHFFEVPSHNLCEHNTVKCVELRGEDLSCFSDKTESVGLRCSYDH